MRTFVWTFLLVVGGIWLFNRLTKAASNGGSITFGPISIKPAESNTYYGPDIDPQTGAYLAPGATPGSSGFQTQPAQ